MLIISTRLRSPLQTLASPSTASIGWKLLQQSSNGGMAWRGGPESLFGELESNFTEETVDAAETRLERVEMEKMLTYDGLVAARKGARQCGCGSETENILDRGRDQRLHDCHGHLPRESGLFIGANAELHERGKEIREENGSGMIARFGVSIDGKDRGADFLEGAREERQGGGVSFGTAKGAGEMLEGRSGLREAHDGVDACGVSAGAADGREHCGGKSATHMKDDVSGQQNPGIFELTGDNGDLRIGCSNEKDIGGLHRGVAGNGATGAEESHSGRSAIGRAIENVADAEHSRARPQRPERLPYFAAADDIESFQAREE